MFARRIWLSFLTLFCAVATCLAQQDNASIMGTVFDSSGAVIPGAKVLIQNEGTAATVELTTGQSGTFAAPILSIGSYKVTASATGFKTHVQENIRLSVADVVRLSISLNPGAVTEQVTVVGETTAVQTGSTTLGGTVNTQQVSQLPLNGRSLTQLLATVPGVSMLGTHTNFNGGTASRLFEAGARFLLDGIDSGQVDSDLMDGGYGTAARMTRASVESIAEVRVQESSYTAEYGQAGGSVINFMTKSGTNNFHGTVFEFFRNEKLDSRNYFNVAPKPKPSFRLNQFGGSIGGPIKRDKAFFFANFEAVRQRLGRTIADQLVPTQAYRDLLAPALRPAVDMLPLPDVGTTDPYVGRFTGGASDQLTENTFAVKVDYNLTQNDRLSVRYNFNNSDTLTTFGVAEGQQTVVPYRSQLSKITYTRTITPTLLNEVGLGVNRLYTVPAAANSEAVRQFPQVNFGGGISSVGPATWDMRVGNLSFTLLDTVSWVKGRNQFKFGTQVIRNHANKLTNFQQWLFFGGLGDPLAPAFLTYASNAPVLIFTVGSPTAGQRNTLWNFFVQDDMQATKNLTFNLGLRYQYDTVPTEAAGRNQNFDFVLGQFDPLGTTLWEAPKKNFGPRFGFAWTPFSGRSFVMRGGYGIYFTSVNAAVSQFMPTNNRLFAQYRSQLFFERVLTGFPTTDIQDGPAAGIVTPVPRDNPTPYTQHWNFNIQQGLGQSTVIHAGYIGNHGVHYAAFYDPNRIDPITGTRPYPAFGGMLQYWNCCDSNYNSLQVSLKRRFTRNLAFNVNWTWSHSFDQGMWAYGTPTNDDHRLDLEYANADYDIQHVLQFDYSYQAPAVPGLPAWLGSGWQFNGLTVMRSGVPVNIDLLPGTDLVGVGSSSLAYRARPNLVPGVALRPSNYSSPNNQINPAAFSIPAAGTFGNAPRNIYRGPAVFNWDFSLFKQFKIREQQRLEFRAEFFNLFNTPQFSGPNSSTLDPLNFGKTTSTIAAAGGFGSNRQIQFALKYIF